MQTLTVSANKGKALRTLVDGTSSQGCGNSKHLYVGRTTSGTDRLYHSLIQFQPAYAANYVGKLLAARLILYSEYDGTISVPSAPAIKVQRALGAFTEGTNADGDFDSSDADTTSATSSDQKTPAMAENNDGATIINVTEMVADMMPASVKRPVSGTGSHTIDSAGTVIFKLVPYNADASHRWAGASEDYTADTLMRPKLELDYEYGPTPPNAPANLTPSGAVATLTAFAGDFADIDSLDLLAYSEVQVYGPVQSGTSATTDLITTTAHGLAAGGVVYFLTLTGGDALVTFTPYYVIASGLTANAFKVSATLNGIAVNITDAHEALTWGRQVYSRTHAATSSEAIAMRFQHAPDETMPRLLTTTDYAWRGRMTDNENSVSPWSALSTFSINNTNPTTPTVSNDPAGPYGTLDGVEFLATYADVDGDPMLAYQIQLAVGVPSDASPQLTLWDTGKVLTAAGATGAATLYSGPAINADTYNWRARVWDARGAVSAWASTSFTLTADFVTEGGQQSAIALRQQAPWRIAIYEMQYNAVGGNVTGAEATDIITTASAHGLAVGQSVRFSALTGGAGLVVGTTYIVATAPTTTTFTLTGVNFTTAITAGTMTRVTTRGPGTMVAVLEDAKSVGASMMFNSPGEMHFTIPLDHPQASVIEPRQTHYAVQFYSGDGWRDIFNGLIVDWDANENDAIFYGIDYLGLYDYVMDERWDPGNENAPPPNGSKYVNKTISYVTAAALNVVKAQTNSPVGFIDVGSIASMSEMVTIWGTYAPSLNFVSGLLDSHRQGSSKMTRVQVRRKTGGWEVVVTDNESVARDNLRLRYGELVQGFRVLPFGDSWSNVANVVGRTRTGIKVMYKSATAPGIATGIWGRWSQASFIDGVDDENDLQRRANRTAIHNGKFGRNLGLGIRSGMLQPRDGYDITNAFPVEIAHGFVDTTAFGSGYWVCYGIAWEAGDTQQQTTILTLLPREDTTAPDGDLNRSSPTLSAQSEFEIGWTPPDVVGATSDVWLDQTSGIVYVRTDIGPSTGGITGAI